MIFRDRQRLPARTTKTLVPGPDRGKRQPPEPPRIHKPQFAPPAQLQRRMSMLRPWDARRNDQQLPGHAQMHDPLRPDLMGTPAAAQIKNNMLALAAHPLNP